MLFKVLKTATFLQIDTAQRRAVNNTIGIVRSVTERTRSDPEWFITVDRSQQISAYTLSRCLCQVRSTFCLQASMGQCILRPVKLRACLFKTQDVCELNWELLSERRVHLLLLATTPDWHKKKSPPIVIVLPAGVRIQNTGMITSMMALLFSSSRVALFSWGPQETSRSRAVGHTHAPVIYTCGILKVSCKLSNVLCWCCLGLVKIRVSSFPFYTVLKLDPSPGGTGVI